MKPDAMAVLLQERFPTLTRVDCADTFLKRALGLMGKTRLEAGRGMLIPRCRSIHTCFMRFPIDVVFLDEHSRPVKIVRNIKPWRLIWGDKKACSVLEVGSGWLT
jgi:uncharacterized membrane protein (UPF0127 family)